MTARGSVRGFAHFGIASLLLGGAAAVFPGCASVVEGFAASFGDVVVIPAADATPPGAVIKVPARGVEARPGEADRVVPVALTDSFFVVGQGEDPEGVKEVLITGSGQVRGINGKGIGVLIHHDFLQVAYRDEDAVGGSAFTTPWVLMNLDMADFLAPAGFTTTSISIVLHVEVTNFGGTKVTTPSVSFRYGTP